MRPLFLGNWKMNKLRAEAQEFCISFLSLLEKEDLSHVRIGIAPPFTLIPLLSELLPENVLLGAQNAHWSDSGAHTGEVSIPMLSELGGKFVILGHSERRALYGETSAVVAKRAIAALNAKMHAVVCVGETKEEFEKGETQGVVLKQLRESVQGITASNVKGLVIAYEPVWAIGTGLTATPEIAESVHKLIRKELLTLFDSSISLSTPIIYGGSTKPENIRDLMSQENIDGALVGGASLEPESFFNLVVNGSNLRLP